MHATDLHDDWSLRATGGPVPQGIVDLTVPATVPGTTHTDLLAAGLIPDPYLGLNENEVAWMHRAQWRYERELACSCVEPDDRVDLVFEGLDTVASVALGGQVLGETANQHRTYRFDVREALAGADEGRMPLTVDFSSALERAESEVERIGARPAAYDYPLGMVRKMACSFGWDWGPDLQTAGIWKPVRLERWRVARLASVRPLVTVTDALDAAQVQVHVDLERSGLGAASAPVTVVARLTRPGGGVVEQTAVVEVGDTSVVVTLEVAQPELWWPVGYGDHPLYDLTVELATLIGTSTSTDTDTTTSDLDRWQRRIGLRSVHLDTSDDEFGTAFTVVVNGTPVFVKGANWIPDDHLLTRITREKLSRRIEQALGAGLNLLRVWGGGIFESEDFYEVCDEAGVMVWQDFLLACAAYPEEEPHRSEFEAEAREHVARLTAHPSLVLWNGGNENLWGYMEWGWQEQLQGRSWGRHYYTELFPAIVAELAPTTPYSDGSPYSPRVALEAMNPNDPDHGTHHQWEVWNRDDYTCYRSEIPRFCSEFGFQGPPAWHTMERAMTGVDGQVARKNDPVWLLHQKAEDGNGKLDRGLEPHLGVPDDFVDWHWATQLNQARAVAHAITHYRSWWPRTAGSIVWQLNDCWPVTSWAAVDGDEIVKPLWWALRSSYAERLLTVQTRPDPSDCSTGEPIEVLAAVNDTGTPWTGQVHVRRETLGGTVMAEANLALDVPPRSVQLLVLPAAVRTPGDPTVEVLVCETFLGLSTAASHRGSLVREVHCFVPDIELALRPDAVSVEVEERAGGYRVSVAAVGGLVKDLTLFVDRLDPAATVDRALVTLPAGQSQTINVCSEVRGLTAALATAPVLRTANDLRRDRSTRTATGPEVVRASLGSGAAMTP